MKVEYRYLRSVCLACSVLQCVSIRLNKVNWTETQLLGRAQTKHAREFTVKIQEPSHFRF